MSESEQVPYGWENKPIKDLGLVITGITPSTKEEHFWGGSIPFISPSDFNSLVYVNATERTVTEKGVGHGKLLPVNSILVTCIGSLGSISMNRVISTTNQQINSIIPNEKHNARFCYYLILHNIDLLRQHAGTTTIPIINKSTFEQIIVVAPPLPEQKKIASIITSVDDVIEKTEAQISKLQNLKKGMMTELLTKGIGNTEFKDSSVGRIPKSWDVATYGDVVYANMPSITLRDFQDYSPVIVRRRHNGIEIREVKKGKSILVKQQYKAIPDTFLISKRQIYHGSCGIVPKDIGDQSIISKEYLALSTKTSLDVRFLNCFSHSEYFQKSIINTTYGIDEEKFVFKEKWWMKELIPLPPLEEQQRICDTIYTVEECLKKKQYKLYQVKALKKALMNDLLTGKKRVELN